MSNIINTYLDYPNLSISLLKNKAIRYTPFCMDETKRFMFVDNLEKELKENDEIDADLKRKYTDKVLDLAFKQNRYFFESSIFDDQGMEKLFNKGKHKTIKLMRKKGIDELVNKDIDSLTREDYLVLISLIGKDDDNPELTKLIHLKYRDLLSKDNLKLYEAEFIIKYTLYISGSKVKAYISNHDYNDNRFKELSHFHFNESEKVLVFNKDYIRKAAKKKNKEIITPKLIVPRTLEIAFLEKEIDDLYNGVINYRTAEIAISNLLRKYIEEYKDEEDFYPLEENDIKALDEIIYCYPNELESYKVLQVFYEMDGTRKKDIDIETDNEHFNYILSLFEKTKKKARTIDLKIEASN